MLAAAAHCRRQTRYGSAKGFRGLLGGTLLAPVHDPIKPLGSQGNAGGHGELAVHHVGREVVVDLEHGAVPAGAQALDPKQRE